MPTVQDQMEGGKWRRKRGLKMSCRRETSQVSERRSDASDWPAWLWLSLALPDCTGCHVDRCLCVCVNCAHSGRTGDRGANPTGRSSQLEASGALAGAAKGALGPPKATGCDWLERRLFGRLAEANHLLAEGVVQLLQTGQLCRVGLGGDGEVSLRTACQQPRPSDADADADADADGREGGDKTDVGDKSSLDRDRRRRDEELLAARRMHQLGVYRYWQNTPPHTFTCSHLHRLPHSAPFALLPTFLHSVDFFHFPSSTASATFYIHSSLPFTTTITPLHWFLSFTIIRFSHFIHSLLSHLSPLPSLDSFSPLR
ncbi:unnamed protein product [Protopolystoma xenopodis]|uniref:Uncharacterized protein n=1 Tax=Protopolystoma xenopodis TaxID=117903 RepID=A0A3S5AN56_9PLAT|nr:unnamed protein product [Protopolystoma xenopodis]